MQIPRLTYLLERIGDLIRVTRNCITNPSVGPCTDRTTGWLLATLIVGALVVAGEQVLAVGEQLGWSDFLDAGEYAPKTTPPDCAIQIHAADRAAATRSCWTAGQKWFLVGLMSLDTVWAWAFYMPLLMLLTRQLLWELSADGSNAGAPVTSPQGGMRWLAAFALPILMASVDTAENLLAVLAGFAIAPLSWLVVATKAKTWLMSSAIVVPTVLLGYWYFGMLAGGNGARAEQRAGLRIAVGRIFWRSRYVLAMLGVFSALAIGMDQSRDVLVGMAQSFQARAEQGQGLDWGAIAVLVPVLILSVLALWRFAPWLQRRLPKRFQAATPISLLALWLLILGLCAYYQPITQLSVNMLFGIVAVWLFAYACWLWSRILVRFCTPKPCLPEPCSESREPDGRDHFAKWWARLLGILPFLLLIWLAGLASGDAARAGAHGMSVGLFFFSTLAAALAFSIQELLKRNPGRDVPDATSASSALTAQGAPSLYYEVVNHHPVCAAEELKRPRYRFPFWLPYAPFTLPLLALAGFQGIRALDLSVGGQMPLSLAAIALALTLWTCVLGLLAQASLRQGMPWVLLLLVLVGLYGAADFTDNHRVLTETYQRTGSGMLWEIWWTQAKLAILIALALAWVWWRSIKPAPDTANRFWRQYWADFSAYAVIAVLAAILLLRADLQLAPERSDPQSLPSAAASADVQAQPRRPTTNPQAAQEDLDIAIRKHIERLLQDKTYRRTESPQSVYFVSAEGGGIRAAYWTALVLQRLECELRDFREGAFSISGVSGGSVGAAVWQVCRSETNARDAVAEPKKGSALAQGSECIDRLGDADLLTPLLSSWLFEDVLATLLPTTADIPWVPLPSCRTPGCGVLSRGHWFERALEASVPGIEQPLIAVNTASPYLFLNSTRVEDGDRAIASPIKINPEPQEGQAAGGHHEEQFPSSVDQLKTLGDRLPLSTAAHNSARFTYVNAIGSAGGWANGHFEEDYHLADGGYFDNSGGHTTADIVRAYTWCLFGPGDPCGISEPRLNQARRQLVPRAFQIRNGVEAHQDDGHAPPEQCKRIRGPSWRDIDTFTGLRAPLETLGNTIGTGANGRVAEDGVCRALRSWRLLREEALRRARDLQEVGAANEREGLPALADGDAQGSTPQLADGGQAQETIPLVVNLDLVDEGVLYPLGWYLSPTAKRDMQRAASKLAIKGMSTRSVH